MGSVHHLGFCGEHRVKSTMLSRLALRSGAFSTSTFKALTASNQAAVIRCMSAVPATENKTVQNWIEANKTYYGPEPDHKNFPHTTRPVNHPTTRMGIFNETWFTAFYEKTGVTGPYMFGVSLTAFLLSKEIWIVEHGFIEFIGFWLAMWYLTKKAGPGMARSLDNMEANYRLKHWEEPMGKIKEDANATIKHGEEGIWQEDGQKFLYQAKRENIDLQLESTYRQRLAEVHQQVKKRLDYQMEMEGAKRKYEQTHMVNWIINNAVKGITPQQEKDSITKCIADLKALSVKAA